MHGLSNSAKRSANYGSTVNQPQGGGDSKAGLIPTAILTSASRVAFTNRGQPKSLAVMRLARFPKAVESRPTGSVANAPRSMNGRFNW